MRATTTTIKYRERSIRWRAKCRTYALILANIRRAKKRHDPPENRTVNFRSKDFPDDRISRSRYWNLWLWLAQLLWKRGQTVFRLNSTRWPRFCWHLSMGESLGRIRRRIFTRTRGSTNSMVWKTRAVNCFILSNVVTSAMDVLYSSYYTRLFCIFRFTIQV